MTRAWSGVGLVLCAACAGSATGHDAAQPPVATIAVAEPAPAVSTAPPAEESAGPTARPSVALTIVAFDRFVSIGVELAARADPDDEIATALPAAFRKRFTTALHDFEQLRSLHGDLVSARGALAGCDGDKPCNAMERAAQAAEKKLDAASRRLHKSVATLVQAMEKALARAKADGGALALALARLGLVDAANRDVEPGVTTPALSLTYGAAMQNAGVASTDSVQAYSRATELTDPSTPLGVAAHYGLVRQYWDTADSSRAIDAIDAMLATAPPELVAELYLRRGLIQGSPGFENHLAASGSFEAATSRRVADDTVPAEVPLELRAIAAYRGQDFALALEVALTTLDVLAAPRPPPAASSPQVGLLALLGGSFADFGAADDVARIAADSLERLGGDVSKLPSASAASRARVLSSLAVRALFRADTTAARSYAEAARDQAPGTSETHDALHVLERLAAQRGDTTEADALRRAREQLPRSGAGLGGLLGVLGNAPLELEESRAVFGDEQLTPDAGRLVQSLVRLCTEPSAWRLEPNHPVTVVVEATLFDGAKPPEVSVHSDDSGKFAGEVTECLRTVTPRVVAASPSSFVASIDLSDVWRSRWSARHGLDVFGAGTDEAFGAGGLGLVGAGRGGGGSGEGLGTGSVGGIGHGAGGGAGTLGVGTGRGRGRKAKPRRPAAKK